MVDADDEKVLSPRTITSFHKAVAEGSVEIVDKLINNDEDGRYQQTTHEGSFPLHHACKGGHISMVRMLLDHSYRSSALQRKSMK